MSVSFSVIPILDARSNVPREVMVLIENLPTELIDFMNSPSNINEMTLIGSFRLLKKFETPFSTGSGAINL